MKEILFKTKTSVRDWTVKHAEGPNARFWLSAVSFAESSFFPIPPDFLLIAILLGNKGRRWVLHSFLTTLFSVLGGIFGYIIGLFFFETLGLFLINTYNLQNEMALVGEYYEANAFLAVFTAAFTPIPYKVFTIAGGFFKISIWQMILASILGRGLRFFGIGFIFNRFGERLGGLIFKYFNVITLVAVLVAVAIYVYFKFFNF